jgi:hypothetical protein
MNLNIRHKGKGFWLSGVRGTGKSTIFVEFLRNYPCDHLLVYDHQGEYAMRVPCFSCYTFEDCDLAWKQGKAVFFNPQKLYPGTKTITENGKQKEIPWGRAEGFRDFSKWVWQKINEDVSRTKLFGWDESGSSVPVHSGYNSHPCRLNVEEGRVRGCDLLWATQQTNQANNQLRNQATDVFAFRHADETACDWLVRKGWPLEVLNSLPDGEYLYKSDRDGKLVHGKVALG